jgi:hypothetical protein
MVDYPIGFTPVPTDRRAKRRNGRVVPVVLIGIIVYLLLLEFGPYFGVSLNQAIASSLGLQSSTSQGAAGAAGPQGDPGLAGLDGRDGSDGGVGLNGRDGRDGADGADGRDGSDGADGADGSGSGLNNGTGEVSIGACDDNVRIRLASRVDAATATFFLNTVSISDIAPACYGQVISVYLFSGTSGSYVQEGVASNVTIPNNSSMTISYTSFDDQSIPSVVLTRLLFEVAG